MSRLAILLVIPVLAIALWASACGGNSDAGTGDSGGGSGDWSAEAIAKSQAQVRAQQANSQLGLGPTRLAFGFFTPDGSMIHGAQASVQLFKLDGDTATVETQEQWDDLTSVDGVVVSSKRGILTLNSYELRRSPGTRDWRITTVASTTVIG